MRKGCFTLGHVAGGQNVSDLLTKSLSRGAFERWRDMMGMRRVMQPTAVEHLVGAIIDVPGLVPPFCSAGHGPMTLLADFRGTVVWRCRRCEQETPWCVYVETQGFGRDDVALTGSPGSFSASVPPPIVINVAAHGGAASSSSSTAAPPRQSVAGGAAMRTRSASAPAHRGRTGGAEAGRTEPEAEPTEIDYGGSHSGLPPTERQRNYIGLIAVRRGWDPTEVLQNIVDRLQASQWIDRYK